MTNGYQKSVQALIKKIQVVAIIVAVIIVAGVVFTSISKWKISEEEEQTTLVSEKIVFAPPLELTDAIEGKSYSYSFCKPDSARSGATCGGLAGATTNPYGGNPPYSFSHQFGVGFIPTGLALELNGLLKGTPTLPGKYTFGVCVTDLYEEVCKTTSLTVRPKSEQLGEQAEEEVSPSVKIESLTATLKKSYVDGNNHRVCEYIIQMSGTATLPPSNYPYNYELEINVCRTGDDCHTPVDYKGGIITCPSWIPHSLGAATCGRDINQPATGSWSVTLDEYIDTYATDHKSVEYRAIVFKLSEIKAQDSFTVTCP